MGYFTKYGDGACDIEVIGSLYKTEVFTMARQLKFPDNIVKKTPSAGLYKGQSDEQELGGCYAEIDRILKSKKFNSKLGKSLKKRIEDNKHKSEIQSLTRSIEPALVVDIESIKNILVVSVPPQNSKPYSTPNNKISSVWSPLKSAIYDPGELQNLVKNDNFKAINDDLSKCVDEFWNTEFKHLEKEY